MKFKTAKGLMKPAIEKRSATAIVALDDAAYQIELVADHLCAKDVDKALRLSRSIRIFAENLNLAVFDLSE